MLRRIGTIALLTVALAAAGCASLPLTGAAPAEEHGVNYTLDGIAYRTFAVPVEPLRRATLAALKRLDLTLRSDDARDDGCREMVATAGDWVVYVELEKLTERTTRIRIIAKNGWIWRDRTAASDIIVRTARVLDEPPALSQRTR